MPHLDEILIPESSPTIGVIDWLLNDLCWLLKPAVPVQSLQDTRYRLGSSLRKLFPLTLQLLRLLPSKAQGRKDFWKTIMSYRYFLDSSRLVLSDEYPCARGSVIF